MSNDPRDAVFSALHQILANDRNAFLLTNDMGAMGVDRIREEFPAQFLNLGIAEQNLISVAAGLAATGKTVFTFGILSHMTARCYEQLRLDVCALGLPVIGIASGAGLSYGVDGPTHHGIYDLGLLRGLPGMHVFNPADARTAGACVELSYLTKRPALIRLDKEAPEPLYEIGTDFADGMKLLRPGRDGTIVATGCSVHRAIAAAEELARDGIHVTVLDLFRLKPVDTDRLEALLRAAPLVVAVEEHSSVGGMGSLLAETIAEMEGPPRFRRLSMGDEFLLGATSRAWAEENRNLGPDGIANAVRDLLDAAAAPQRSPARRVA